MALLDWLMRRNLVLQNYLAISLYNKTLSRKVRRIDVPDLYAQNQAPFSISRVLARKHDELDRADYFG